MAKRAQKPRQVRHSLLGIGFSLAERESIALAKGRHISQLDIHARVHHCSEKAADLNKKGGGWYASG